MGSQLASISRLNKSQTNSSLADVHLINVLDISEDNNRGGSFKPFMASAV